MKDVELGSGARIPALGLGTWKSDPGEVGAAIEEAVKIGYRHFDCAAIYGNEDEIGDALRKCVVDGLVTREELWITSKLWNDHHAQGEVEEGLRKTLGDLGLDYLDLYLVHWPVAHKKGVLGPESADDMIPLEELPLSETWKGMEGVHKAGLARHLGVSNFSIAKLESLMDGARVVPTMNQVELHPYLQQQALVDWCHAHGVRVTAYSPLGSQDRVERLKTPGEPVLLDDPVVGEIAGRTGVTPAQVLIAWALARGTVVIPKSVNPERMRQNFAAGRVALTERDLAQLASVERARRYIDGSFWALEGGSYTVANLWNE